MSNLFLSFFIIVLLIISRSVYHLDFLFDIISFKNFNPNLSFRLENEDFAYLLLYHFPRIVMLYSGE